MTGHKQLVVAFIFGILMVLGQSLAAGLPSADVDLVVFSKDRPLQLEALLRSCKKYLTGVAKTAVIYCVSTAEFDAAYEIVKKEFPNVNFVKQSANPRADFKPLTNTLVFGLPSPYVLFAVDDIIMTNYVDLSYCVAQLEAQRAYGFYLRLGKDITECYAERSVTGTPPLQQVATGVYSWRFHQGSGDWAYPHTVDMALYRKRDLKAVFKSLDFTTPNTLEGLWASRVTSKTMNCTGLCFEQSKMVNLPLNLVQKDYPNRCASVLDVLVLLKKFQEGYRIDVDALHQLPHKAPHVEYIPPFIAQ